jgi:hypothetical protein
MGYYQVKIYRKVKVLLINLILLVFSIQANAQSNPVKYELETQATLTTNGAVPFWMRSNQYGSIPLSGLSGSFIGRANKEYKKILGIDTLNKKLFDWGFGFEGRANMGKGSNFQLIEAYGKLKISALQLKVGRSKDVMGLNGDTTLSSGNFAVSGNSLGIPQLELSIPEYFGLPILNGLFSIKGNFVHGWLGKTKILDRLGTPGNPEYYKLLNNHPTSYFHQKSLYVRLGQPLWKLQLYGGLNHQVFWDDLKAAYESKLTLSKFETFKYVVLGKAYSTSSIPRSKIGNQLGSIDMAAEYNFKDAKITIYRQNFYDVGALSKFANIKDGLNGISIVNKKYKNKGFNWKKALFEFFYSKDQAGYPWSIPTASGDEDYYNNYYFSNGWSSKGLGIGTPLITPKNYAKNGQASDNFDYFINNRIIAIHVGLNSEFKKWNFISKISYSWNYGTFATSIYGKSTGSKFAEPNLTNLFIPVQQLSFLLKSYKNLNNGYTLGLSTAFDQGNLLNTSIGLQFSLAKSFY